MVAVNSTSSPPPPVLRVFGCGCGDVGPEGIPGRLRPLAAVEPLAYLAELVAGHRQARSSSRIASTISSSLSSSSMLAGVIRAMPQCSALTGRT